MTASDAAASAAQASKSSKKHKKRKQQQQQQNDVESDLPSSNQSVLAVASDSSMIGLPSTESTISNPPAQAHKKQKQSSTSSSSKDAVDALAEDETNDDKDCPTQSTESTSSTSTKQSTLESISSSSSSPSTKSSLNTKSVVDVASALGAERSVIINTNTESKSKPADDDNDLPDSEVNYDFASLAIHDATKKAIFEDLKYTRMTEVQAKCIPVALSGVDIMGSAKTGSGKTVAFLVPAIELLVRVGFKPRNGTGIIVISPTRELALQIYGVARELCRHHHFTHGLVMGGTNKRAEIDRLVKGVNLLIGTPGRLLDHLNTTQGFIYKSLAALVIDEADRILEIGFEEELRDILTKLPKQRQSMLFSATQTQNVVDIARICLARGKPVYIGVNDKSSISTVVGVEQGYVICPSEQRFLLLFTYLKKNLKKKIIVFFSTCSATQFYSELLNYIDVPVLELHGKQKQTKRTTTFFEFVNADKGILCCTDVAARGLDVPEVDMIIQFDPPDDYKEYLHRVGRTGRGEGKKGKALLFLLPQEVAFLRLLSQARIPLSEYEFPLNKLANVQAQLEKLIAKNYYLHKSAREAYRSYIQAYSQHSLKQIFDVNALKVQHVAKSFGFDAPPAVQLKVSLKSTKSNKHQIQNEQSSNRRDAARNGFDAQNPYGVQQNKQWSR